MQIKKSHATAANSCLIQVEKVRPKVERGKQAPAREGSDVPTQDSSCAVAAAER